MAAAQAAHLSAQNYHKQPIQPRHGQHHRISSSADMPTQLHKHPQRIMLPTILLVVGQGRLARIKTTMLLLLPLPRTIRKLIRQITSEEQIDHRRPQQIVVKMGKLTTESCGSRPSWIIRDYAMIWLEHVMNSALPRKNSTQWFRLRQLPAG